MRYLLLLVLIAGCAHADPYDRRVRIKNDTSYYILAFYASNTSRTDWEEDILGDEIITPYTAAVINIDDGSGYCLYDLKAVFADGETVERHDVNVCETTEWRLYE